MSNQLKKGDEVSWNSRNGKTHGKVVKKVTSQTEAEKHHLNASKEDVKFEVKSAKTGKTALHKPSALKKS